MIRRSLKFQFACCKQLQTYFDVPKVKSVENKIRLVC